MSWPVGLLIAAGLVARGLEFDAAILFRFALLVALVEALAAQRRGTTEWLAAAVAVVGVLASAIAALAIPDSSALSGRLLRLGAMAATAIPLLAVTFRAQFAPDLGKLARLGRAIFVVGMVALPLSLFIAAAFPGLSLLTGPGSDCVTIPTIIAVWLSWKARDWRSFAAWGALITSMGLGKLMGAYAFDGPLEAPAALEHYAQPWRVVVRTLHIDSMMAGFVLLLASGRRQWLPFLVAIAALGGVVIWRAL